MIHNRKSEFETAEPVEFFENIVRKSEPSNQPADGQKDELAQEVGGCGDDPAEWDDTLYVIAVPEFVPADPEFIPSGLEFVSGDHTSDVCRSGEAKVEPRRKRGRPRKSGPRLRKLPSLDRRRRGLQGPLRPADRRNLTDGVEFSADPPVPILSLPMTTTVDVHPAKLDAYPSGDLREWFRCGPWAAMSEFMRRRGVDWRAIAVRENYEGERREHFHLIMFCPADMVADLGAMLKRRWPGAGAFRVGTLTTGGLAYRFKQSAGNSFGPPRPGRQSPERRSRHDGAPVAAVDGKRTFVSQSIDRPARVRSGWQATRDAERAARSDYYKARAREEADARSGGKKPPAPSFGMPSWFDDPFIRDQLDRLYEAEIDRWSWRPVTGFAVASMAA